MNFKKISKLTLAGLLCVGYMASAQTATNVVFADDFSGWAVGALSGQVVNAPWSIVPGDDEDASEIVDTGSKSNLVFKTEGNEIICSTAGMSFTSPGVVPGDGVIIEMDVTFVPNDDAPGIEGDLDVQTAFYVRYNEEEPYYDNNGIGKLFAYVAVVDSAFKLSNSWEYVCDVATNVSYNIRVVKRFNEFGLEPFFEYYVDDVPYNVNVSNPLEAWYAANNATASLSTKIPSSVSFQGTGALDYFAFKEEVQDAPVATFELIVNKVFGLTTVTITNDVPLNLLDFVAFSDVEDYDGGYWNLDSSDIDLVLDANVNYEYIGGEYVVYPGMFTAGTSYEVEAIYTYGGSSTPTHFGGSNQGGKIKFRNPAMPTGALDEPEDYLVFTDAVFDLEGGSVTLSYTAYGEVTDITEPLNISVIVGTDLAGGTEKLEATLDAQAITSGDEVFSGTITIPLDSTPLDGAPVLFFKGIDLVEPEPTP